MHVDRQEFWRTREKNQYIQGQELEGKVLTGEERWKEGTKAIPGAML